MRGFFFFFLNFRQTPTHSPGAPFIELLVFTFLHLYTFFTFMYKFMYEYKAAIEQPERKEKFLSYWCYEGILATCTDTFKLTVNI